MDAAISADGRTLATIDTFLTNCVKIWDVETQTQLRALPKTNWTGQWCRFAPDGNLLVAGSDRTVVLWNVETAEPMRAFNGVTGAVSMISDLWMPNDTTVGAIASDGATYLWNFTTAGLTLVVPGTNVIAAIGVPNDFLVVNSATDWKIRIRQCPAAIRSERFKVTRPRFIQAWPSRRMGNTCSAEARKPRHVYGIEKQALP